MAIQVRTGRKKLPTRRGLFFLVLLVSLSLLPGTLLADDDSPHDSDDLDCAECHSDEAWKPIKAQVEFDHGSAGFELRQGHRAVACRSCHEDLRFARVPTACADCHTEPHRGEMGFDCEGCHTTAGWDNRRQMFEVHDARLFPLSGSHARLDCAACHREGPPFEYRSTPVDCLSCHLEDYRTAGFDHVALGLPTECESCHTAVSWSQARFGGGFGFDHGAVFALTGAHQGLDCTDCHTSGFGDTPTECYGCHAADYDGTDDPNHVQAGFPTTCETCHETDRWEGATFNHRQYFRLTGAHKGLDCVACHADGYAGTPTECYGCHAADYDGTDDPNHVQAGFPTTCETCHSTTQWEGATFDHDQAFRLTGAHQGLDCLACHADGYAGTPTDCYSCHASEYDGTDDPNHLQAGFPTTCETCHETSDWEGATFDHRQFFRLTGAHAGLDCVACHAGGYAGTPTECYGCHAADYNGTDDPDHSQAGFPTTCETCHETNRWEGATFDHDQYFRLTGAHTSLECDSCHADGYAGTPTDCFACHVSDYNGTRDPDHQDAGFPTECELCHTTRQWGGADFTDHDALYFPIFSGNHRGEWDACTDCHTVTSNFSRFECINCHEHNKSDMDSEHDDVGGYVYESNACLSCHPRGEE